MSHRDYGCRVSVFVVGYGLRVVGVGLSAGWLVVVGWLLGAVHCRCWVGAWRTPRGWPRGSVLSGWVVGLAVGEDGEDDGEGECDGH